MNALNFSWVIPGRLAGHSAPQSVNDLVYLKQQGIKSLVRMAGSGKAMLTTLQITEQGLLDCYEPVPDFSAPKPAQIDLMVGFIQQSLHSGKPVGVSCGAGLGRTGTVLASFLVSQGIDGDAAIDEVRKKRPGSIETAEQEHSVKKYAASPTH